MEFVATTATVMDAHATGRQTGDGQTDGQALVLKTTSTSKTPQNQQKEKGETKKEKGEENQQ
jgi:hypothetical protein